MYLLFGLCVEIRKNVRWLVLSTVKSRTFSFAGCLKLLFDEIEKCDDYGNPLEIIHVFFLAECIVQASGKQCLLQQGEHGRGQFCQCCDAPACLREQAGDGRAFDADGVDLETGPTGCLQSLDGRGDGVGVPICQDEDELAALLQGQHGLHDPPQGRSQGGSPKCPDVHVGREFCPVFHKGAHAVSRCLGGKGRHGGVDALGAVQRLGNGVTGLAGKVYGYARHASAYVQQDMHGGVQARAFLLLAEHPGICRTQSVQFSGMQAATATSTDITQGMRLQQALQATPQGNACPQRFFPFCRGDGSGLCCAHRGNGQSRILWPRLMCVEVLRRVLSPCPGQVFFLCGEQGCNGGGGAGCLTVFLRLL